MTTFHPSTPKKCPPNDAVAPDGTFYRVVFNNPPLSEDFCIWILERRNEHLREEKTKKGDCSAFAISMFTTMDSTIRIIELFRRPINQKAKIKGGLFLGCAKVKLDSNSGLIKQTGNNRAHYDLWPFMTSKLEASVISVTDFT